MDEPKQANFEGWAVVELMGHQREIGFVATEAYGQAVMFRIDTPGLPDREFILTRPEYVFGSDDAERRWMPEGTRVKRAALAPRTRLVAPGSLYAINPCTEEAARAALETTALRPLILLDVAPMKVISSGPVVVEDIDDEDPGPDF